MTAGMGTPRRPRAITDVQAFQPLDTTAMFNGAVPDDTLSPLDQFIANTQAINTVYLRAAYQTAQADEEAPADVSHGSVEAGLETMVDEETGEGSEPDVMDGPYVEAMENAAAVPGEPPFLLSSEPPAISAELGALAVLGYMSAVESYFRALIRKLIEVDDQVRSLVEPMTISYGAACHHNAALLPEALMEHMSFAGEKTIVDVLRNLLGIKGNLSNEVNEVLKEFKKVCEVRHCCVHRFGRLGSKSAMTLGIRDHSTLLELPFAPTLDDLQRVSAFLRTFVKTINNFVYREIIERTARNGARRDEFAYGWNWTGRWEEDEVQFRRYYGAFSSNNDTPPSPEIAVMYEDVKVMLAARRVSRREGRSNARQNEAGESLGQA